MKSLRPKVNCTWLGKRIADLSASPLPPSFILFLPKSPFTPAFLLTFLPKTHPVKCYVDGQGHIWRAFRAFPGRPWRRTQDSVGHKTDDIRERKKRKKNEWEKGKMCKEKKTDEREREKWTEINGKR